MYVIISQSLDAQSVNCLELMASGPIAFRALIFHQLTSHLVGCDGKSVVGI